MRKPINTEIKDKILKRSKGKCEVCRMAEAQDIHHIVPVCDGGSNDINNLVHLCHECHRQVPGSYPDGYKEEFEIYRSNGGPYWGLMAAYFQFGWQSREYLEHKETDYRQMSDEFQKFKQMFIKGKVAFPPRITMSYGVFK